MRCALIGVALVVGTAVFGCANKADRDKAEPAAAAPIAAATEPAAVKANAPATDANDKPVNKQALADKVRELSRGMPDIHGPRISVPPQWQQCKVASDCEVVYSGCGIDNVAVNKASVAKTEAKWKQACERVKESSIAALVANSEPRCSSNRCSTSAAGLDAALEKYGGLSGRIGKGPFEGGPVARRASPSASIAVTKPRVKGSLDPAIVRRVVRSRQRQWLYCYEREQIRSGKKPAVAQVEVSFEVDARGKTAKASATGDGGTKLDDCIAMRVRRWRYPAPPKGDVNYVTLKVKFTPAPKPAEAPTKSGSDVGDKRSP